jgi:hypothetical protein
VDPGGAYVRKPARWSDLPFSAHGLLERFVRGRLLVSRGEGTERVLEAAHEALIRRWGKFRGWVEEDREFLRTRERMEGAAARWLEAGRDPSLLLPRGRPLAEAQDIQIARRPDLAPDIIEFIDASITAKRAQDEEEQKVQQERLEAARDHEAAARRLARRTLVAAFALGVLALFAMGAGWIAINQLRDSYLGQAVALRGTLDPQRRSNSLDLLAKAASSKSLDLLAEAAKLRLAKLGVGNDLRDEAVAGMALVELQNRKAWNGYPSGSKGIGFNSSLELYARGDPQGNISIRRVEDDKELMQLPGRSGNDPWVLRFSPDDRYLAAKYDSDELRDQLYLWDLSYPGTKAKHFGTTYNAAFDFDPSSQVLAVGRCDGSGSIDIFELASASSRPTKRLKQALPCWEDCLHSLAFRPDGRQLAVSSSDAVQVLELNEDKAVLNVTIPRGVNGLTWNADGGLLAAAANDHQIYVWDIANLRPGPNPPPPLRF